MRNVTPTSVDADGRKSLQFKFHPHRFEEGLHAVEKQEGEVKRRYLAGVSSGLKPDLHGERMTQKAIDGFMEQANSGDVLLYEGQHGVNGTEDLGILHRGEILANGDWFTEYRLFDTLDNFDPGSRTLERADKLWKQVNGIRPYKVAKQKGFSVEGFIPDGGIMSVGAGGKRVIDLVKLDGVLVVSRPAYGDSITTAVFKAFEGEDAPWVVEKSIASRLRDKLRQEEVEESFFRQRWRIQEAFDEILKEIMQQEGVDTANLLRIAFEEYRDLMVDLLLRSQEHFRTEEANGHAPDAPSLVYGSDESLARQKRELLRQITDSTGQLVEKLQARGGNP